MNVIVILLDTLRWDAVGCYNNKWIKTPCIDHYAKDALIFNNAHCGSFPTIPMRADAYTGDVNWPRYGWKEIDQEQPKLPSILRDEGYYTGIVLDTKNNHKLGYTTFYDECRFIDKDVDDGVTRDMIEVPVPKDHLRHNGRQYISDRVSTSHYKNEEDWFGVRTMREACKWLEDNAKRDKFFLWVDTFEIHENWMPPGYYVDLYDKDYNGLDYTYPRYGYTDVYKPEHLNHMRAAYAGEVTLVDRWVGQLLRQIELMGLFEDTCVILTSDHGIYIGEHNRTGKHTLDINDPWPCYETITKVPLIIWSPLAKKSKNISALVQSADIMPTVLEHCGITPPDTVGKSWLPLIKGEEEDCHEVVYTTCHSGNGPGQVPFIRSHITVTTKNHMAIFGTKPHKPELYDRIKDPEQKNDIASSNPEIVEKLRKKLVEFMEQQGAEREYIRKYALGK